MLTRARIALLALALVGAATAQTTNDNAKVASAEARFLQSAAHDGMAEVELGRLGQQRGMHDEVKQFAARMVADHGKANDELKALAAAKGVSLPTAIDRKHQRLAEKLNGLSGPDFDREYMQHMLADHRKTVKSFARFARNGKDADVKSFAANTLSTLQSHLRAAQATRDIVMTGKRTGNRETGSTKP